MNKINLTLPGKSKKKRGSVMDFFSPFGDTKPFGGFGSHMSGARNRLKQRDKEETLSVFQ